jgi:hypothetical protein
VLVTALIILNTLLLGALIVFLLKFKASIPDIQQVLDDVGASISEQLTQIFEKPSVSRAMSVLGSKSGDARASKALKAKVAEKALGSNVLVKKALEYLDITPVEGLELMNDPTIGPIIQNALAGGLGGFTKGFGRGNSGRGPNPRNKVPDMS